MPSLPAALDRRITSESRRMKPLCGGLIMKLNFFNTKVLRRARIA
jgi:hypothetical protein